MQNMTPDNAQGQTVFTSPVHATSGSQQPLQNALNATKPMQPGNQPSFFYTQDQEDDLDFHLPLESEQDDPAEQSSPLVLPFQHSAPMPTLPQMQAQGAPGSMGTPQPGVSSSGTTRRRTFRTLRILLLVGVVLTVVLGASILILAQPVPSPHLMQANRTAGTPLAPQASSTRQATVHPSSSQGQGFGIAPVALLPSASVLRSLGWIQAGLQAGDALEALRTGATFTDREMSYDYRNIGTLTAHSGTLTGSTFLLTPGGLARFARNDVRVINDVLYDRIRAGKMIQQVVNAQPSLVSFQTIQVQGQPQQIAWVNVAFELFQSKIDPASGKRVESLEASSATGQPLIHHLVVVLLHVPLQSQGANAPMGGTGWLVNTYELDPGTLPIVLTEPAL